MFFFLISFFFSLYLSLNTFITPSFSNYKAKSDNGSFANGLTWTFAPKLDHATYYYYYYFLVLSDHFHVCVCAYKPMYILFEPCDGCTTTQRPRRITPRISCDYMFFMYSVCLFSQLKKKKWLKEWRCRWNLECLDEECNEIFTWENMHQYACFRKPLARARLQAKSRRPLVITTM